MYIIVQSLIWFEINLGTLVFFIRFGNLIFLLNLLKMSPVEPFCIYSTCSALMKSEYTMFKNISRLWARNTASRRWP